MGNAFKSVLASGGSGGGIHVDTLTITSQPTLKTYVQGETIDTTGMVCTASASGMSGTVTQYCTVSPQVLDTVGTQVVTVSYGDATATFNVTVYAIESISIISQPTKTVYIQGETLDLTGISVRAIAGSLTRDVTNSCTYSPANGSTLSSSGTITITASLGGLSDTTTVTSYAISEIEITTPPNRTTYRPNEQLNLTGIVVTAIAGTLTKDVTASCTFNPANGTTLTTIGSYTLTATYQSFTDTMTYEVVNTAVYGVQWDGSSDPSWTRTDDSASFADPVVYYYGMPGYEIPTSPFDNRMPWSGMQIVEDEDAGTLVSIPKFWYKWTRNGSTMKLQISDGEQEGFLVSPAHADRGDGAGERDVVYVGRYQCAPTTYKSTTGVVPITNKTRAECRTNIHNLGSTIWQWDFAMWWTINMLYLVEFANWNSQKKIGGGASRTEDTDSSPYNTGYTDSFSYHTGTGSHSTGAGTKGITQYRHIEALWANVFTWIDSIYFSDTTIYGIKNPANFSDDTGGTNIGTRATTYGVISDWTSPSVSGFEYALYPSTTDETDNDTYVCDRCSYDRTGTVVYSGNRYNPRTNSDYGIFFLNGEFSTNNKANFIGCRLMKLP